MPQFSALPDSHEPQLPAARDPRAPYRIAVVCLGNICRSPIAEVVLTKTLAEAGLADQVTVTSSGTGDWHVGQPMDRRAASTLRAAGYDGSVHRARQVTSDWFAHHDALLAMDNSNYRDLTTMARLAHHLAGEARQVRMFREFDPGAGETDLEVPDPYYGGEDGFGAVLTIVERTAANLAGILTAKLPDLRSMDETAG